MTAPSGSQLRVLPLDQRSGASVGLLVQDMPASQRVHLMQNWFG